MTDEKDPLPSDTANVFADDQLLTSLSRAEPPPADDDVAVMLFAWRAELASDDTVSATGLDRHLPRRPEGSTAPPGVGRRVLARGARRVRPAVVAVATAAVLIGGAVTVAAANAGPDSPLWPITTVVFGDRADDRLTREQADQAISQAREAIAEARYADATRLLDEAAGLVDKIDDEAAVRELLDEILAVRDLLPEASAVLSVTSSPSAPGQAPTTITNPTPEPSSTGAALPLPSPLPLPSLQPPPPVRLPLPPPPSIVLPSLASTL